MELQDTFSKPLHSLDLCAYFQRRKNGTGPQRVGTVFSKFMSNNTSEEGLIPQRPSVKQAFCSFVL